MQGLIRFVHFFLFLGVFCCCTRLCLSGVQTLHCALILWEINKRPRTHSAGFVIFHWLYPSFR